MPTTDRHLHPLTHTTPEAARHYEHALDALLFFRPEVVEHSADLLRASPDSPMGQALNAYLAVLATEEKDTAAARAPYTRFRTALDPSAVTPRERMHLAAAGACLDGDLHGAARILDELAVGWPRDALALLAGHQLDFLTGDAGRLRDRIGGALSAWDPEDPHYGPLRGMYSFGLEESGHYEQAEEAGLDALARNPRDVWGVHGVSHTFEMRGRYEDGMRFLDARTADWATGNFLTVHNWWHYALFALEAGDVPRVLDIYDSAVHPPDAPALAMQLLDASALLWRLLLAGHDVPDRWERLAQDWAERADGPFYAFNDVHAVMAYVGAGRIKDAEALVADRQRWLDRSPAGPGLSPAGPGLSNLAMTTDIGLPVCEALIAYGTGRDLRTVDLLLPLRHRLASFGGSHAQRDAVQKTLLEAALRAGRHDLARTLLSERIALRPSSPYNWLAQARLADSLGHHAEAATARRRAHGDAP
ncbi:tetratricopeptide repeat protein 38 family protein [Streptomyces spiroverticillatus]|uniref:Tetratricopeptide repeat protein 38 n=1 Tax=Streptomyces finlayi TaxID=67296 RepID=A0A919C9C0_9ACTN|nr:tetratricopeptide repeat protein [Streptomyces finlayi]GHA06258.1 tetratricopeptide repeat protein 38 family protein [Streptomyces spiroverticillatus]GHC89898.1 tetratricopeptide repeat protein 38 family protein [Streptomyces finlayi]